MRDNIPGDGVDSDTAQGPPAAKLLLVDDQPVNLLALESVLEPLGVQIVTAGSGSEALKQVLMPDNDFAAILLDVQMPGMDGFEVARLIKERERSRYVPILFITAASDNAAFIFSAYAAGAVDFLPKPFVPEILLAKVSVFIDLYRQREAIRRQEARLRQSEQREEILRQQVREQTFLREIAEREREKAALASTVQEMTLRQKRFLREVLFNLTEGRLRLCDTRGDLPAPLPPLADPIGLSARTLRGLRRQVQASGAAAGWESEPLQDFLTAVGEAAMNAVVHGREARGMVCGQVEEGVLQVWVEDEGSGIAEDSLHRATLERGFTTAGTLGHGFWLMLRTCQKVYLLTGETGTTIVLEQDRVVADPAWLLRFFDKSDIALAPAVDALPGSL